jgi:hypothetical protein
MKVKEVPQDTVNKSFRRGDTADMHYAVDDNGKVVQVWSKGWDVSENSWKTLWDMFAEMANDAKERIKQGRTSPIEYFMHNAKLDLPLFAAQMEMSKRKIKKHFDPRVFDRIDDKTLQKYADYFKISLNDLKNFKKGIE